MKDKNAFTMTAIAAFLAAAFIAGCGGGTGSRGNANDEGEAIPAGEIDQLEEELTEGLSPGTGDAIGDTLSQFQAMFDVIPDTFEAVFEVDEDRNSSPDTIQPLPELAVLKNQSRAINETFPCNSSGEVSVTGETVQSEGGGTFDLLLDYGACDGVNGKLEQAGSVSISENAFQVEAELNGVVAGENCALTLDEFRVNTGGPSNAQVSLTLNGTMTATCLESSGEARVTCTWSNLNSENAEVLRSACSCQGAGC